MTAAKKVAMTTISNKQLSKTSGAWGHHWARHNPYVGAYYAANPGWYGYAPAPAPVQYAPVPYAPAYAYPGYAPVPRHGMIEMHWGHR